MRSIVFHSVVSIMWVSSLEFHRVCVPLCGASWITSYRRTRVSSIKSDDSIRLDRLFDFGDSIIFNRIGSENLSAGPDRSDLREYCTRNQACQSHIVILNI